MNISKILVVVDPKKKNDTLISRIKRLAVNYGASVELYIPSYNAAIANSHWLYQEGMEQARKLYIEKKQQWLNSLVNDLNAGGIDAGGCVEWVKPKHRGVLDRVDKVGADLIVMRAEQHSVMVRAIFSNTDWHLIRESQVPLLFVHDNDWGSHLSIAAAVDPLHVDSTLDDLLLQTSHGLACRLPAELHVIHAYEPIPIGVLSEFDTIITNYESYRQAVRERHREALDKLLMKNVEPSTIVHFEEGVPTSVLPQVVNETEIDLIVMGALSQSGIDNFLLGSTAEQVIDHLRCDILILKE